jgi:hypothetical protein
VGSSQPEGAFMSFLEQVALGVLVLAAIDLLAFLIIVIAIRVASRNSRPKL